MFIYPIEQLNFPTPNTRKSSSSALRLNSIIGLISSHRNELFQSLHVRRAPPSTFMSSDDLTFNCLRSVSTSALKRVICSWEEAKKVVPERGEFMSAGAGYEMDYSRAGLETMRKLWRLAQATSEKVCSVQIVSALSRKSWVFFHSLQFLCKLEIVHSTSARYNTWSMTQKSEEVAVK